MRETRFPLYPGVDIMDVAQMQMSQKDSIIADYFNTLRPDELEVAEYIAETMYEPAKPLADTVAIIPVAAAQEVENISRAIAQYARQKTRSPFSLVIGLNLDYEHYSQEDPRVRASIEAVSEQKKNTHN